MGRILSLLLAVILIILILFLFAPQLFVGAQNSLINAINSVAGTGQAQVVPQGNNMLLKLGGLSANSKYYVTLDQNQCGSSTFRDVGTITADKNGTGSEVLPTSSLSTQQIWFVNVHQGANDMGTSVACRQLDLTNSSQSNTSLPQTFSSGTSGLSISISTTGSTGTGGTGTGSTGTTSSTDTSTSNVTGITSSDATNFYASGVEDQSAGGTSPKVFPNTGVAPGGSDSYDNYTFPRKY